MSRSRRAWRMHLAAIAWAAGCADEDWVYRPRDAARSGGPGDVDLGEVLQFDATPPDVPHGDVAVDDGLRLDVTSGEDHSEAATPLDADVPDRAGADVATGADTGPGVDAVRDVGALDDTPEDACTPGSVRCDGRCVVIASDASHCGACGRRCTAVNGEAQCVDGACRLTRCLDGWMDCNRNPADGCERDVRNDPANCGGCGLPCSFPEASARCVGGRCTIASCARRYLDCDGDMANGCEVDLISDSRHCEVCGNACPSGTSCQGGCAGSAPFAGYTVTEPSGVAWVDACSLPGAVHHLPDADSGYARGEVPFSLAFWGRTHRRYVVSPDGLVGFGLDLTLEGSRPTAPPYRSWGALPAPDVPYPAAFALGADLVAGPDGVCVASMGAAPARRFVVAWPGARFVASGSRPLDAALPRVSVEAIFHETSGLIDFVYQGPFDTPTGPTIAAQTAITVGLVDYRSGIPVRAVPFSGNVGAETRVRFAPR